MRMPDFYDNCSLDEWVLTLMVPLFAYLLSCLTLGLPPIYPSLFVVLWLIIANCLNSILFGSPNCYLWSYVKAFRFFKPCFQCKIICLLKLIPEIKNLKSWINKCSTLKHILRVRILKISSRVSKSILITILRPEHNKGTLIMNS